MYSTTFSPCTPDVGLSKTHISCSTKCLREISSLLTPSFPPILDTTTLPIGLSICLLNCKVRA
uniref:Putative ovule protein n=1 Tax=Solanum chacoense TaxID=4108 RepID=A0A0V0GHT7_SOLCH